MYLLDDGLHLWLIVGAQAAPEEVTALFGVPSLEGYDVSNLCLPALENERSQRVRLLVSELRAGRPYFCPLRIVRQTDA